MYYVAEGKTIETALREYEKQRPVHRSLLHASGEILQTAGVGAFCPDSFAKIKIERWNSFGYSQRISEKNLLEQGHGSRFQRTKFLICSSIN